jgi:hypothetical protein
MSVGGGVHPTVVTDVDIDRVLAITKIDTEQLGCILADVVVVLDFQLLLGLGVLAVSVVGIASATTGMVTAPEGGPDGRPWPLPPALAPPLDGG